MVEPTEPQYEYLRIAQLINERITTMEPYAFLPGERKFAEELGTSLGTLRKALKLLAAEGRVRTLPAKGHYVIKDESS